MTARDDQLKYDYICGLVEQTYPILAPVWQAARARFGAAWLREFIENIEAVYGTVDVGIEGRLGDALDGYAEFVNDSLRNQSFYEKHGRYKASSYAECVDAYYHNADHMIRCYLPGMYLSHLLWPQHYNMLCGFQGEHAAAAGTAQTVLRSRRRLRHVFQGPARLFSGNSRRRL